MALIHTGDLIQMLTNIWTFISLYMDQEYMYYLLILAGISVGYFIMYPLITWFVTLQTKRLLSYLVSSLLVLTLFLMILIFIGKTEEMILIGLKMSLQCIAGFGLFLGLRHGVKIAFKRT